MRRLLIAIAALLGGVAAWAHWPPAPLPADAVAERLVVLKSARQLELYHGGTLLRRYRVSLGANPMGPKQRSGDGRTPEGEYVIDYHNAGSSFHRALHISYPSKSDRARAAARGVDPGGLIMIHGLRNGLGWLGRLQRLWDWTDGCVAVTDTEIEEISRAVPDGTRIELRP